MQCGGSSDMSMFRNLLMRKAQKADEIRFSDERIVMDTLRNETEKKTYVISNSDWRLDIKL